MTGRIRPLTRPERRYVLAAARGLTAQQTAFRYGVSLHTVNTSLKDAKGALGALSIAHAVGLALAAGEFSVTDILCGVRDGR